MEVQSSPKVREKGLSLIELLVAIVILTFGAIAVMSVLIEAHTSHAFSRGKTIAINAAEQEMESIFKDFPSNVGIYNNQHFAVPGLYGPAGNDPDGGNDPLVVTITDNEMGLVGLHRVIVTVTWVGTGTRRGGRITLSALRSTADR